MKNNNTFSYVVSKGMCILLACVGLAHSDEYSIATEGPTMWSEGATIDPARTVTKKSATETIEDLLSRCGQTCSEEDTCEGFLLYRAWGAANEVCLWVTDADRSNYVVCAADYILCVSYEKTKVAAEDTVPLPSEGACDYVDSSYIMEISTDRHELSYQVNAGDFLFKYSSTSADDGSLAASFVKCGDMCNDNQRCIGYHLEYPFTTTKWPQSGDRYLCWGLAKLITESSSEGHSYGFRRSCKVPLDKLTCNGLTDSFSYCKRDDRCDVEVVQTNCPAVCDSCVADSTTSSTVTTETTASSVTTTTRTTTTATTVTPTTTTVTTTTVTVTTTTKTSTTRTTTTHTTSTTTVTETTTTKTTTTETTITVTTTTTQTTTTQTSSTITLTSATFTGSTTTRPTSTVTSSTVTRTTTTKTTTTKTDTTKTSTTMTTVTVTDTTTTQTTKTATTTTGTGTTNTQTTTTLTDTTGTSTTGTETTVTATTITKSTTTGTTVTSTLTTTTRSTTTVTTKTTTTNTETEGPTTIPPSTQLPPSTTIPPTTTTMTTTTTQTSTTQSTYTRPWDYFFFSDTSGGPTGRFNTALEARFRLFTLPSPGNPGGATLEMCERQCDKLDACAGFYFFQETVSSEHTCYGLSDVGLSNDSPMAPCTSLLCISYEKRHPSTTSSTVTTTILKTETTTTHTTTTTTLKDCDNCLSGSGPCVFAEIGVCAELSDGACPSGSVACSTLDSIQSNEATYCIGEISSGIGPTHSLLGKGTVCSDAPYRYEFTRAAFNVLIERPTRPLNFLRYCLGTKVEGDDQYSKSFFKLLSQGQTCEEPEGYETRQVWLPRYQSDETVTACLLEEKGTDKFFVQILGRRTQTNVEKPCLVPNTTEWASDPMYLNLIDFCEEGYKSDLLSQCKDVDECAEDIHRCDAQHATCNNEVPPDFYTCACNAGWEDGVQDEEEGYSYGYGVSTDDSVYIPSEGVYCIDVDECSTRVDDCDSQATCSNEDGSFTCACNVGWQVVNGSVTGTECEDIDECADPDTFCHADAHCNNLIGSFQCVCDLGFEGSGLECQDVDECETDANDCSPNATCTDIEGSFTCACDIGWRHSNLAPIGTVCLDVDECASGIHECDVQADCANVPGSYECNCNLGFVGNGTDCSNVDECSVSNPVHDCSIESQCVDSLGSFLCECNTGWRAVSGSATDCEDINECFELTDIVCDEHAICDNTNGSFTCTCQPGFSGNGSIGFCDQINECISETDGHDCDEHATCRDTGGAFECGVWIRREGADDIFLDQSCNTGWTGDGKACQDVDECNVPCTLESPPCAVCPPHGSCANSDGSFECVCEPGFEHASFDDDRTCSNFNECERNPSICDTNAQCFDTIGSFSCECNLGWEVSSEDSNQCVDVNECLHSDVPEDNPCGEHSICTNADGSFQCHCIVGYFDETRSGPEGATICVDIDECVDDPAEVGLSLLSNSIHDCDSQGTCENSEGSFSCSCNPGYEGNGTICDNIDECALASLSDGSAIEELDDSDGLCHTFAACVDTAGSFECACNSGYSAINQAGPLVCEDIDECVGTPCANLKNSECVNVQGSFECVCDHGFLNAPGICEDVNECAVESVAACCEGGTNKTITDRNGQCSNRIGSYDCECRDGYIESREQCGKSCVDIDECSIPRLVEANCDPNAICSNLDGSFVCNCREGYDGDGSVCFNRNECDRKDWHRCNDIHPCIDTDGSFFCDCGQNCDLEGGCDGWTWNADEGTCEDKLECSGGSPCENTQRCVELEGSFFCVCNRALGWETTGSEDLEGEVLPTGSVSCEVFSEVWFSAPARNLTERQVFAALSDKFVRVAPWLETSQQCDSVVYVNLTASQDDLTSGTILEMNVFLSDIASQSLSIDIGPTSIVAANVDPCPEPAPTTTTVVNTTEIVSEADSKRASTESWLIVGLVCGVAFFMALFIGGCGMYKQRKTGSADMGASNGLSPTRKRGIVSPTPINPGAHTYVASPQMEPVRHQSPPFETQSGQELGFMGSPVSLGMPNSALMSPTAMQTFVAYSHEALLNLAHTLSWLHGPYYGGVETLQRAETVLRHYIYTDGVFLVYTTEDPTHEDHLSPGHTLLYTCRGSIVAVDVKPGQSGRLLINGMEHGPWRRIEHLIADVLDQSSMPRVEWLGTRLRQWIDRVTMLPIDIDDADQLMKYRFPEIFLLLQATPDDTPPVTTGKTSLEYYRALAHSRFRHSTGSYIDSRQSRRLSSPPPMQQEEDSMITTSLDYPGYVTTDTETRL